MLDSKETVSLSKAFIAVNRFGYGAIGNELSEAKKNPQKWVKSQLQTITFNDDLPSSEQILKAHAVYQKQKKQQKRMLAEGVTPNDENKAVKQFARQSYLKFSTKAVSKAVNSQHSVSWRLLDFFSNHFSVTASGRLMVGLAATLEREAIAPNMLGQFDDLLLAVTQHPAMLVYLNNERSFGQHSRIGKRRKKGLNENLAREILELHTLGVNGGYSQNDVTELAKGITGWSITNFRKEDGKGFVFRSNGHEPGERALLGKKYRQEGVNQGKAMLFALANHPHTAKFVCTKLVHHFVSEQPLPALVADMVKTWHKTTGNIRAVLETMFENEHAWQETFQKYKTPRELVISAYRAVATDEYSKKALLAALTHLGQKPFSAGSPAGFSDEKKDWLSANSVMTRIDWVSLAARKAKQKNTETLIAHTFGLRNENLNSLTYSTVMSAESRQQGLALLLLSPEFQWR